MENGNTVDTLSKKIPLSFATIPKSIFIGSLFIIFLCYAVFLNTSSHSLLRRNSNATVNSRTTLLDHCQYIYIDMGTNIGVQIRKLYEPHLYPEASVLPLFREVFGNHTHEVCSIGFEANPLHSSYLKEFEAYCLKRQWRVKIFTSTAVSIVNSNLTLYTEPGNEKNNQWGASLEQISYIGKSNVTVPSIDIISWFQSVVLQRQYAENRPTKIMMKSDMEGHDQTVLAAFIFRGVYCSVDLIYGEHLSEEFRNAIEVLLKSSKACPTKLVYMDDEFYHTSRFPFNLTNTSARSR